MKHSNSIRRDLYDNTYTLAPTPSNLLISFILIPENRKVSRRSIQVQGDRDDRLADFIEKLTRRSFAISFLDITKHYTLASLLSFEVARKARRVQFHRTHNRHSQFDTFQVAIIPIETAFITLGWSYRNFQSLDKVSSIEKTLSNHVNVIFRLL